MQVVKYNFFSLLVYFLLLSKNDVSFSFNCVAFQFGILKNVRNDIDSLVNIFSESLCIVHSLFSRCVGIQVSTQILHLKLQIALRSFASSWRWVWLATLSNKVPHNPLMLTLEGHVFQKVSGSVCPICFCSRTGINPRSNCGCLSSWIRFSSYSQTIWQGSSLGNGLLRKREIGRVSSMIYLCFIWKIKWLTLWWIAVARDLGKAKLGFAGLKTAERGCCLRALVSKRAADIVAPIDRLQKQRKKEREKPTGLFFSLSLFLPSPLLQNSRATKRFLSFRRLRLAAARDPVLAFFYWTTFILFPSQV